MIQPKVKLLKDCHACSLRLDHTPVSAIGHGKLMIVGEAPELSELKKGKVFSGLTRNAVDHFLEKLDKKRSEVILTTALKCPLPESRKPKDIELISCQEWLDKEIRELKPLFILAMGKTAARMLLKRDQIGHLRGRTHFYHSIPVIVTYHPMIFNRFSERRQAIENDLRFMKRKLNRARLEMQKGYSMNEWMLA